MNNILKRFVLACLCITGCGKIDENKESSIDNDNEESCNRVILDKVDPQTYKIRNNAVPVEKISVQEKGQGL